MAATSCAQRRDRNHGEGGGKERGMAHNQADNQTEHQAPSQQRATNAVTVLIIDDSPKLLKLLGEALAELGGLRVVTAEDGAQGLQLYFETRPQCVVIDVKMPNLDGYQLVHALRGDPASAETPLVILSALAQDKDRLAGLLSGADCYLIKPVTPLELLAAIRQALALSAAERARRLQALLDTPDETPRGQ
jgi:CheY-like chemotaxis protein